MFLKLVIFDVLSTGLKTQVGSSNYLTICRVLLEYTLIV